MKHLDLGCGGNPRNPFGADEIYGVDITERDFSKTVRDLNFEFRATNLVIDPIPFPDNYFDSVSAYDFIEHIPRVIYKDGLTILPFIQLMSEIFRVLKGGGEFFAVTPFYPKESAFMDPTHVNFITKNSHKYFVEPYTWAKMYGFDGNFLCLRCDVVNFESEVNGRHGARAVFSKVLETLLPRLRQHIVWRFRAIKHY
jgi:SAM-dependent methyltransferase